mmetsp:Transcript_88640/g.223210  ORF Transcript_88640/g.223210 Transcript_88640/m.223210 type:complete len:327 (+) Transcript_88640:624-1604(+)
MIVEGVGKLLLLVGVLRLDQGAHPEDVVAVGAVGPAGGHLGPRGDALLSREVGRDRQEGLPVDAALAPHGLAEEVSWGVARGLALREVEVEEDPLPQHRVRHDAREVVAAEEELVGAARDPEEVDLFQGHVLASPFHINFIFAEHSHDPCHERQEGGDAYAGADRDEDVAAQGGGRGRGVGAVHGDRGEIGSELVLVVQALLGQGLCPIASACDDEVNGFVFPAGDNREWVPLPRRILGHVQVGIHAGPEIPQPRRLGDLQGCECPSLTAFRAWPDDGGEDAHGAAFEHVVPHHAEDPVNRVQTHGDGAKRQDERHADAEPALQPV